MYTEEEIYKMQKSKSYWDRNDLNYKQINDDVSSWYKEHYGTKEKENESDQKEKTSNELEEKQVVPPKKEGKSHQEISIIDVPSKEELPIITKEKSVEPKLHQQTDNENNNLMDELKQQMLAAYDMTKNYFDMKRDNTKKADDYFHCKANYEATKRGKYGENFASKWGDRKELVDLFRNILFKNMGFYDAFIDYLHDTVVNAEGRQKSKNDVYLSGKEACAPYRVKGINGKY